MTDIARWLEGLGLGKYAATLADAEIDLAAAPHLTDDASNAHDRRRRGRSDTDPDSPETVA
jgi:hypothetical protein